ncbi:hypothetical protein CNEONATNEC32_02015 [Clostridium neonatale]|nr:hypothetical protein CNEONATNEC32_02015 [Clostridium neonatale]
MYLNPANISLTSAFLLFAIFNEKSQAPYPIITSIKALIIEKIIAVTHMINIATSESINPAVLFINEDIILGIHVIIPPIKNVPTASPHLPLNEFLASLLKSEQFIQFIFLSPFLYYTSYILPYIIIKQKYKLCNSKRLNQQYSVLIKPIF